MTVVTRDGERTYASLGAGRGMAHDPTRILAIGDIHGCARALDALLAAVAPTPDDLIVTLGDYVDRGLDSAGVINRLIRLVETHPLVALRGASNCGATAAATRR